MEDMMKGRKNASSRSSSSRLFEALEQRVLFAGPEINLFEMSGTQIPFVSNKVFDIGTVPAGRNRDGVVQFRVRNDGDAVLALGVASTPDGFLVDGLAQHLNPGEQDEF